VSNLPEKCILAIDPGLSGAAAWFFPAHPELISAEDLPVAGHEIDAAALRRRIDQMRPDVAIIEQVAARPGQGVSSMFRFGQAYGTVIGVIAGAGIPLYRTSPSRWKKHYHLDSDKEAARALAIRLWPSSAHFGLKKHHGRAEAALLARYAAETLVGGGQ
jgi:hypothetical protein